MGLSCYRTFMKIAGKEKYFSVRKQIAIEALKNGIKPTANKYFMSKNTVRTWIRRFQKEGNDGLYDRRKGPDHIPHKTPQHIEDEIVKYRKIASCYGAKRLKYFFDLKTSVGAIQRILKERGLTKKQRRKHEKKNDLRAIKARYKSFEKTQMDIKYLTDIPPYWEQMRKLNLPRFQYTMRDVKSGMIFLGFANSISIEKSITMLHYVLNIMSPLFDGEMIIQTDNGAEFSGTTRHYERNYFTNAVNEHGGKHKYIPPGHCNANADVESIHQTIEEEFYNLTTFSSRADFFTKAESYKNFYNLVRPNFSKGAKTPWAIGQEDHPGTDLATIAQSIGVIDLDAAIRLPPAGGQPLPVLSDCS